VSRHLVSYATDGWEPSTVSAGKSLSVELDASTSPLLFGCRTGICGTCLVEVVSGWEHLPAADSDERELLEVLTDNPRARLACQLEVQGNLCLRPLPQ
jgi:ferredoxin